MALKLITEFKEFVIKGNMIDIAIGVILGAAFNDVVNAIVKEILLPPISLLTGGVNLANRRLVLRDAITENGMVQAEEVAIGYGNLIESGLDFLIIGLTVFLMIKIMNTLQNKADDPENLSEVTPKDIELLHKMTELMEKQIEQLEAIKSK